MFIVLGTQDAGDLPVKADFRAFFATDATTYIGITRGFVDERPAVKDLIAFRAKSHACCLPMLRREICSAKDSLTLCVKVFVSMSK